MSDFSTLGGSEGKTEAFGLSSLSRGTIITTGGVANTKTAWVEMIASTGYEYDRVMLSMEKTNNVSQFLFDIGIGGAGSEEVIVPNILMAAENHDEAEIHVAFDVTVPRGTRIAVRVQSSSTSQPTHVRGMGMTGGFVNSPAGTRIVDHGSDTSASGGTEIEPGGTANTKGAWSELVASSGEDIKGFWIGVGDQANSAQSDIFWQIDIGVGAASSEEIIVFDVGFSGNSAESQGSIMIPWIPVQVPKGSRIAARCQCSSTNAADRTRDVIVYGLI